MSSPVLQFMYLFSVYNRKINSYGRNHSENTFLNVVNAF